MALGIGALCTASFAVAEAGAYIQTNLVSDIPGLATITDPILVNPWGVSHSTTSPFWISNQGTSKPAFSITSARPHRRKVRERAERQYRDPDTAADPPRDRPARSAMPIPRPPVSRSANGGNGGSARFIFANLNGTISGWDGGPTAFIQATTPGAVYTGLAINSAQTRLYAANKAGTGSINVFDSTFAPVSLGRRRICRHPRFARRLRPVQRAEHRRQDLRDLRARRARRPVRRHRGNGGPSRFSTRTARLLQTLIIGSKLAAPWGIALAPCRFRPVRRRPAGRQFQLCRRARSTPSTR